MTWMWVLRGLFIVGSTDYCEIEIWRSPWTSNSISMRMLAAEAADAPKTAEKTRVRKKCMMRRLGCLWEARHWLCWSEWVLYDGFYRLWGLFVQTTLAPNLASYLRHGVVHAQISNDLTRFINRHRPEIRNFVIPGSQDLTRKAYIAPVIICVTINIWHDVWLEFSHQKCSMRIIVTNWATARWKYQNMGGIFYSVRFTNRS